MSHNLLKQLIVEHDIQLSFMELSNLKITITIVSSDVSLNPIVRIKSECEFNQNHYDAVYD